MMFKGSYPSVITGEYSYFQAVQSIGFRAAHHQMLRELKSWFEVNRPEQSSFGSANEAFRIHKNFLRLVMASWAQGATLKEMDRMFIEVFGTSGRAIVEGELPRSRFMLENTLGSWDLPQRVRARSKAEVLSSIRSN